MESSSEQVIQPDTADELKQMEMHPENDAPTGAENLEKTTDDPTALYDLDVPNASPPQ
jgi:hypothetical protein